MKKKSLNPNSLSYKHVNFSEKKYLSMLDDYLNSLDCKGLGCNRLEKMKKDYIFLLNRYKSILKLQRQNECIFSQILHDIKSPLLGVKYALENACDSEFRDEIYRINLNVLQIIQEFLTLYSFTEGFKKIIHEEVFPFAILKNQVDIYTPLLKQKELYVKIDGNAELSFYSHEAILSRIISNFLSNAIKYAPVSSVIELNFLESKNTVVFNVVNCVTKQELCDKTSYGLGFFIIKRLAKRISAKVSIKNDSKKNIFKLKVPKIDYLNHAL